MKKFIGTALVLCCLALPLAGCEDAISTVTSTTMSELEDIPNQILATPESAEMKPEYNYIHLQTRVDVLFLPKIKIKRDKNLAHLCESDIIALIR